MKSYVTYKFTENKYSVITLNRPEKKNAISLEMVEQLNAALTRAKKDKGNFLVLNSKGNVFCAGGDLKDFHGNLEVEQIRKQLSMMKDVLTEFVSFPVPTICLLSGDAYGGGCELASACDIRIAKEESKFGFVQSNLGILPGWGGGSLLYERIDSSFAMRWIMEGKVFSAPYLEKKAWIHKVIHKSDWDEELILRPYINKTRVQMEFIKLQYNEYISTFTLFKNMTNEVNRCSTLWGSKRHKEAIHKALHKNK